MDFWVRFRVRHPVLLEGQKSTQNPRRFPRHANYTKSTHPRSLRRHASWLVGIRTPVFAEICSEICSRLPCEFVARCPPWSFHYELHHTRPFESVVLRAECCETRWCPYRPTSSRFLFAVGVCACVITYLILFTEFQAPASKSLGERGHHLQKPALVLKQVWEQVPVCL